MNCREQVWMCMAVHVHVPEQLCMTLTEPKSKVAKSTSHHPESISGPLARMNRPRARLISGPLAKVVGHGIRDGHINQAAAATLAVEASGEAFFGARQVRWALGQVLLLGLGPGVLGLGPGVVGLWPGVVGLGPGVVGLWPGTSSLSLLF